MHQHRRRHLGSSWFGSSRSRFGQAARREFWFKPLTSWPGRSPRVGQAARRELARPLAMPPASPPALTTPCHEPEPEERNRDAAVRMEIGGTLGSLDAGLLERILDFILYHRPIIEPYDECMTVGPRDLVFSEQGCRYWARRWRPRGHFGVCGQSCGCCRAHNWEDVYTGCPECGNGWTVSTLCLVFRIATEMNAWKARPRDASWFAS